MVLPLSRTVSLAVDPGSVPADAGAVAVTSANALRHASPDLIGRLSHLPCHAVGARTAEAARRAGFADVVAGPGDATALAERISATLSGTLVYLCGRVRFPGFEERLAASGVRVDALEVYDTVTIGHDEESVREALDGRPVEAVLLYSAVAAGAMRGLLERESLRPLFAETEYFALSARVAAGLGDESAAMVNVAEQPSEPALLALLTQRRGR
ncbi:uroporphyrinogen-III synthase [Aquamicrobium terrae]|uniref:Uroporphyrinogen-III synthase n=1 Tax=Aquamicrobium terrae TaxID=1324945 RepID=A0ABV2N7U6_9HYPH